MVQFSMVMMQQKSLFTSTPVTKFRPEIVRINAIDRAFRLEIVI